MVFIGVCPEMMTGWRINDCEVCSGDNQQLTNSRRRMVKGEQKTPSEHFSPSNNAAIGGGGVRLLARIGATTVALLGCLGTIRGILVAAAARHSTAGK